MTVWNIFVYKLDNFRQNYKCALNLFIQRNPINSLMILKGSYGSSIMWYNTCTCCHAFKSSFLETKSLD